MKPFGKELDDAITAEDVGPGEAVGERGARVGIGITEEVGAATRVPEVVKEAEGRAYLDRLVILLRGYGARDACDLPVAIQIRCGSKASLGPGSSLLQKLTSVTCPAELKVFVVKQ